MHGCLVFLFVVLLTLFIQFLPTAIWFLFTGELRLPQF
jgi:hypothetical protein